MTDDTQERLQYAQDVISTITQQRDNALNTVAELNARMASVQRKHAETVGKLAEAERKLAELTAIPREPKTNGHDIEAATH